jgi:hypothetical protein
VDKLTPEEKEERKRQLRASGNGFIPFDPENLPIFPNPNARSLPKNEDQDSSNRE